MNVKNIEREDRVFRKKEKEESFNDDDKNNDYYYVENHEKWLRRDGERPSY